MTSLLAHFTHDMSTGFFAGFQHPWGGWDHLFAMLGVGLWAAQGQRLQIWKAPLSFVIGMIGGIFLATLHPAGSLVEGMIVASVVVSGLLLMFRFHAFMPLALVVLAIFGIFHGAAHAMERGDGTSAGAYFAGMVMGTMCLHTAGLLIGLLMERVDRFVLQAAGAMMVAAVPLFLIFA